MCSEKRVKEKKRFRNSLWRPMQLTCLVILGERLQAQDANAAINEANTKVRSYFDSGTNLMYAVGAILGLIGAVKV